MEPVVNNFTSLTRTGHQNAIPAIQGSAVTGGTSESLPKLEALSIKT